MKEIKTTLDGVLLTDKRADGNTTRQVDAAIQYLFNGYRVKCIFRSGRISDYFLTRMIMNRLNLEHPRIGYLFDRSNNIIELL